MSSTAVSAKGGWFKKLAIFFAVVIILLVLSFFWATSAGFLKSFILPKVSKSIGATVTVEDASISPFSEVRLTGLKVQTAGSEPLLTAGEVHARYKLWDIISGNINVSEATINDATATVVQNADGTSNLDPLLKQLMGEKKEDKNKPSTGKTTQLDVRNVALKNATIRLVKQNSDGTRATVDLKNVNLTADQLKNGQPVKVTLGTEALVQRSGPVNDLIQATLTAGLEVTLDDKLTPVAAKAEKTTIQISQAGGAFKDLAGAAAYIEVGWTPTEVRQLGVKFAQNGKNLGEIAVSGPFDPAKLEGKLKVQVSGIDRQVLSLVGAAAGMDFGSTVLASVNTIELANGGQSITVDGQLTASRFSVTREKLSTPPLELQADYALNVDQTGKTALVRSFALKAAQGQKPLLTGTLAKPMKLDWGKAGEAVDESALDLAVTDLNLADWRAFTGDTVQAGVVNLKLGILSQQAGRRLQLSATGGVDNLAAQSGSNRLDRAAVQFEARAQVDEFNQVGLSKLQATITQDREAVLNLSGTGNFNVRTQDADLQANLEGILSRLTALAKVPNLSVAAGSVKFTGKVAQKNLNPGQASAPAFDRSVAGQLQLANFTGNYAAYKLDRFDTTMDCDLELKGQLANIRKLAGQLRQAGQESGRFEVAGNYQLDKQNGQFTVTLDGFNQNALSPFLASALGDKTLKSVTVNSKTTAKYDAQGESTLNTELQVLNLVVHDPEGKVPESPLEVKFLAGGTYAKNALNLQNASVALTPTARARNQVDLKGQFDFARTNAYTGKLSLTAESLDLTPYYNLFDKSGKTNTTAAAAPAPAPAAAPVTPTEPAAMQLPFQSLTASVNVGRCYLREVAITNFVTTLAVTNNRVLLNPFQLTLNGAPVNASADVNLGVAGYTYDVTAKADRIPLEPLINSFSPDKRGMYQGEILVDAKIKGAGVTGPSLRQNLGGQANFAFTNANIQIVGPKLKPIVTVIATVLSVEDILKSPINWIYADATIGKGQVDLTRCTILSEAFRADAPGTIMLNDVITNSTLNLPVDFSLRRSIAAKANLLPSDTPTNAVYAKLPAFAKVTGTIGQPKTETDKLVITGLLLKSSTALPVRVGGKAGDILQGVGNFLTGQKPAADTNAPAANTPPAAAPEKPRVNPFDILRNVLDKKKTENPRPEQK